MSVWGKLAGAAAGLAIGGPIGALLGGVAGHYVIDRDEEEDGPAENQVAFTVGVIALGAKMAKADGVVTMDEVNAFKEVFKVPDGEMKNVARVFNLAKQDVAGYEAYAEQLATMFKGNRKLLEDVLEGLFHIAKADEDLHPQRGAVPAPASPSASASPTPSSAISRPATSLPPSAILTTCWALKPSITNEELKSHYRRLVADNHPDKLMARGVPKEFISIATEKVATINEAYDRSPKSGACSRPVFNSRHGRACPGSTNAFLKLGFKTWIPA